MWRLLSAFPLLRNGIVQKPLFVGVGSGVGVGGIFVCFVFRVWIFFSTCMVVVLKIGVQWFQCHDVPVMLGVVRMLLRVL